MSDNNRTVRIAKNNLCAHVNQFIDKEKTALEHLLMNQYTTFCLGSHYQHDAQQVRSQSRPGSIGNGHDGTVDKRLDLIAILCRNKNIISSLFEFNTQTAETFGNNTQIFV